MIELVWILFFHSPVLLDDAQRRTWATHAACERVAARQNRSLRGSALYYECVPMSTGEARSFRFPQVAP
jgi:hypothetical protein